MNDNDIKKAGALANTLLILPYYAAIGWGALAIFVLLGFILGKELATVVAIIVCLGWALSKMLFDLFIATLFFIGRRAIQNASKKEKNDEPPSSEPPTAAA